MSSPAEPAINATAMMTPTTRAARDWTCQMGEASSDSKLGSSLGWIQLRALFGGGPERPRRARHQSIGPQLFTQ
jgi:hypothetical protein